MSADRAKMLAALQVAQQGARRLVHPQLDELRSRNQPTEGQRWSVFASVRVSLVPRWHIYVNTFGNARGRCFGVESLEAWMTLQLLAAPKTSRTQTAES